MNMRQAILFTMLSACTGMSLDVPTDPVICTDACACDDDIVVCVGDSPRCQDMCACTDGAELVCFVVTQQKPMFSMRPMDQQREPDSMFIRP